MASHGVLKTLAIVSIGLAADTHYGLEKIAQGEAMGISIVGSIVNQQASTNVALIKNLETNKVSAVTEGYLLKNRFQILKIHLEYILVEHLPSGEQKFIYQDKFLTNRGSSGQPSQAYLHQEDGLLVQDDRILMTKKFRDRIINEQLERIFLDATAVPYYIDGSLKGFRLIQINQESLFDDVGFQNNDVIESINGDSLNSIRNTFKILDSLTSKDQVTIRYLRKGILKTKDISVN